MVGLRVNMDVKKKRLVDDKSTLVASFNDQYFMEYRAATDFMTHPD